MPSKIFLSYARQDAAAVDLIREELAAAGHDVWVDTADLRGGDRWRAAIVRGIEQADTVVVVLSRYSIASDHVLIEVNIASEQETRMIPVSLDDAKVIGGLRYSLSGLQQIDLATDQEAGLQALLAALDPTQPIHSVPVPAPSPRSSSRYWKWVAGALGSAVVVLAVVLVLDDEDPGPDPTTTSLPGEEITLEAEEGVIFDPMRPKEDSSGVGFVSSAEDNKGSVRLSFETRGGEYAVWARVASNPGNLTGSDSFFVSINGGEEDIWDLFETGEQSSDWEWDAVSLRCGSNSDDVHKCDPWHPFFEPGEHQITFSTREPNTKLDVVVVTTDLFDRPPVPGS